MRTGTSRTSIVARGRSEFVARQACEQAGRQAGWPAWPAAQAGTGTSTGTEIV